MDSFQSGRCPTVENSRGRIPLHASSWPNGIVETASVLKGKGLGSFLATLLPMNPAHSTSGKRFSATLSWSRTLRGVVVLLAVWVMAGPSSLDASAQRRATRSVDELSGTLREAVMTANATTLMMQAAETVEINLFGERRFYSRGQATLLLNELFKERRPESARIVRSRRTPSAAFVEALVEFRAGENAQWLVRYALQRGEWRIRELTVEEAND